IIQFAGKVEGIGVLLEGAQQFRPDSDDFCVHSGSLNQKQGLDAPGEMEDRVVGGQHRTARASEGKTNEIVSGNNQGGFFVRSDFDDAALAAHRGSDVKVSSSIESQSLRAAKAAIEGCNRAVGINGVDGVVTGGCWSGYIKRAGGGKGHMVSGHAGFQSGKDKKLLVAGNAPDGAGAVADIEVLFMIEGDSGGDAHAFSIGAHGPIGSNAINGAVVTR